ncbi:N5-glutamine methyltransferase family protein [Hoyosella subflava]|uniref:rRNA or tRNA methylase n=1 Tax=Hoyosella subflava (strain DSM 45089 / JCM 17490 / NBRC 109087 / DQS3-9A1) TaxID=443218 RepID=F6ELF7_HOYSD|nr:class I SAM-dependent methyltransferase [Hoyosella subflava]AEF40207.1 rRNA or tRNA methylase [Hoyosella subflava DQS3-9A1]
MTHENTTAVWTTLREVFESISFTADGVIEVLGDSGLAALDRGEPGAVRRYCRDAGQLGLLIRYFMLGDPLPADDVIHALAPLSARELIRAGLFAPNEAGVAESPIDIRPLDTGSGTRWIVSDFDASMSDRELSTDHVLGVGAASLSLLRATPVGPAERVLDLGTGCGIQAVHAATYAGSITATDISARSLRLAEATFALNNIDVDVRAGSWFEPVEGELFDQIVANPPFVVSGPSVELTYRDSGLELDGASALVVQKSVEHLRPGGTAALLASWVHQEGADWRARVASWLPDEGVDAWFVQRDIADKDLYVSTWLRDTDVDLRTPAGIARQEQWLTHLDHAGVDAIGFGFVFLRRTDAPSDILCEDLRHSFDDPLGDEASQYLQRVAWLRTHDLLTERLVLNPNSALERVSVPGADGWDSVVTRIHRTEGPRWQHEIDDLGVMLLGGLRGVEGLPFGDVLELLAATTDEASEEMVASGLALAEALIRHGIVLPAEIFSNRGGAA